MSAQKEFDRLGEKLAKNHARLKSARANVSQSGDEGSGGPKNAEGLAREFHEKYEKLAPEFGYETREETREFDPESKNGRLMIAVCGTLLDIGVVRF